MTNEINENHWLKCFKCPKCETVHLNKELKFCTIDGANLIEIELSLDTLAEINLQEVKSAEAVAVVAEILDECLEKVCLELSTDENDEEETQAILNNDEANSLEIEISSDEQLIEINLDEIRRNSNLEMKINPQYNQLERFILLFFFLCFVLNRDCGRNFKNYRFCAKFILNK